MMLHSCTLTNCRTLTGPLGPSEAVPQTDECPANIRGAVRTTCGLRTLIPAATAAAVWWLRRQCPYYDGSLVSPSPAARAKTVVRNAADAIAHHVTLEIEALDCLCLNVDHLQLQPAGGIVVFLSAIVASRLPTPRWRLP